MAVIRNMASYIHAFNSLPDDEVNGMLHDLELAIDRDEYLFVLPQ